MTLNRRSTGLHMGVVAWLSAALVAAGLFSTPARAQNAGGVSACADSAEIADVGDVRVRLMRGPPLGARIVFRIRTTGGSPLRLDFHQTIDAAQAREGVDVLAPGFIQVGPASSDARTQMRAIYFRVGPISTSGGFSRLQLGEGGDGDEFVQRIAAGETMEVRIRRYDGETVEFETRLDPQDYRRLNARLGAIVRELEDRLQRDQCWSDPG